MYKIFIVSAVLALASSVPVDHQATSYSSFNDNHNSIHHIDSAPSHLNKYAAAPVPQYYAAPAVAKVALPVAKIALPAAPVYQTAPKYSYAPAPVSYAAPIAKVAALPVATKYAVPVAKYASYDAHKEEYAPAQYEFAYNIEDAHTGDFHSQQEHRDGDHVVGQYALHEADGTVRIVKYSDDGHGFNAVVERQGHPTEAPVAYKKIVAAAPAPAYYHH
ncbi:cuticle protein 8-like [Anthonomus grandis grandis]|uniref:cuticle protein 8-like n=1 Tax=Anthonomus grandis grandis TaxID=2921223 RepID=UPI002165B4BD|nr:cuticle protein 8-like [Anthonomus grandis grandis]